MDHNIESYNEYLFMEKLCSELSAVSQNTYNLLLDLSNPPKCFDLEPDLTRLQHETRILVDNVDFLICDKIKSSKVVAELQAEIAEVKGQNRKLQLECDKQQEQMKQMELEIKKLQYQLQQQSEFCASLGAITGNLLWKCSRLSNVITMMLAGNKIVDFLGLVSGSLVTFLETYDSEMPASDSDEAQFIMSLCGIVTNIAAVSRGRNFLATNKKGQELVSNMIRALPFIPVPSGNTLKRLILMTIFNVSINQSGLEMLQVDPDIATVLSHSLEKQPSSESRHMVLKVVKSITSEIKSPEILQKFLNKLPLTLLQDVINTGDSEMKGLAQDVINNYQNATNHFSL